MHAQITLPSSPHYREVVAHCSRSCSQRAGSAPSAMLLLLYRKQPLFPYRPPRLFCAPDAARKMGLAALCLQGYNRYRPAAAVASQ